MKKKLLVALTAASLFTVSAAYASPLMDYSQGKASVDLTYRNVQITGQDSTGTQDYNKKYNLDFGATIGLGNNFAFQYNYYSPESKQTTIGVLNLTAKAKSQEMNVLYKLDKNLSVYTGINRVGGELTESTLGTQSFKTYNRWQLGLIGTTKLADKLTGYANVAAGNKITKWGIGAGYEFAPNLEFNVEYLSIKATDIETTDGSYKADNTVKGLGFGVTYKF